MHEDEKGNRFVVKRGANAKHVEEEVLADEIYRGLGVNVPKPEMRDGVKITPFIQGKSLNEYLKTATPAQAKAIKAKLQQHFLADAILGNWDVIGMAGDNVLIDDHGEVWRIDNGGSLRFRAMGTPKDADWNEYPTELWSMRDKSNAQTHKIFGDLGMFDLAQQKLDPRAWAHAPAEVKAILDKRYAHFQDVAKKVLDLKSRCRLFLTATSLQPTCGNDPPEMVAAPSWATKKTNSHSWPKSRSIT